MLNKSINSANMKPNKSAQSVRKPMTPTALYSGLPTTQRALQQRYFGSASAWRSTSSSAWRQTRDRSTPLLATEPIGPVIDYHPWTDEFSKIVTREKNIKSMTKDSYGSWFRLKTAAVESITTNEECCPKLISPQAVKVQIVNIQQSICPPRLQVRTITRFVRRNEPMPSERPIQQSKSARRSLPNEIQLNQPILPAPDPIKTTGVAPTLATSSRLLNRAKMQVDPSMIRRPPRKLRINMTHETIMPLSVYG